MQAEQEYFQNPDVSCRPEEPEGGILYNPVEDAIELVNMTGLTIWRFVKGTSIRQIAKEMSEVFDNIPSDQLEADIKEFVLHLVEKGFIKESSS